MEAEQAGWVSFLRLVVQSSGTGQWAKTVLRGFQTFQITQIMHVVAKTARTEGKNTKGVQ